jgi:hypothetical protein
MFASFVAAEGPNTELSWLLYAGLVFFLLVILSGWLSSPKETGQARTRDEARKPERKSAGRAKRSAGGVSQRRGRAIGAVKGARRNKVK